MIIKYVCAWCGKEYKPPIDDGKTDGQEVTSHGLCDISCYQRWCNEANKLIDQHYCPDIQK